MGGLAQDRVMQGQSTSLDENIIDGNACSACIDRT
jgi:hypothetical protein